MIEALTGIWQQLLNRSSVGIEDNFFDLGGDPSRAVKLFEEIARIYGRDLPPLLIYQAPTIAALATLLQQPGAIHFQPLVPLRNGIEKPPIFIAHGLGGSVMELFQLVRHLESPLPVFGLQLPGMDGLTPPLNSIEAMAEFYLDAVKRAQAAGPYCLIGYSFGGLVMFEMAQRLSAKGESIALLAMLDSYPHPSQLSVRQRTRLIGRRFSRAIQLRIRRQSRDSVARGSELYHPPATAAFAPAMQRVRESAYSAWKQYSPRFYKGNIRFLRAAIPSTFPDDPTTVWGHLAGKLEIETVPGDHRGMITTNAASLAAVLNRLRDDAAGLK